MFGGVDPWAAGHIPPLPRLSLGDYTPPGGAKRDTRLARQRVSDQSPIAQRLGSAPRGAIKHRISIAGQAFRACSIHLKSPAVIEKSRHRTTDHRDAHNFAAAGDSDAELVTGRRRMVPVMTTDEVNRFIESDGTQVEVRH
ncbi:hypothetical protein PFJ02_20650 [Mycobacterium xenopi]|nr:hypothetical protein [Mycobacterium xenopi]MDA3641974.1 hypothetical protein [Mycobacterium xenopi]MDA3659861.1 hypothetical protein [Mycobacterium xenopi]MDA3664406.1 hypothetical protein [Mycobacterium xenopi]